MVIKLFFAGTVVGTGDIQDSTCLNNLCTFTADLPLAGFYTILVNAVDRAANRSGDQINFTAGPRDVVQNLGVVKPVFVDPVLGGTVNTADPRFQWNPPLSLPKPLDPTGGIVTYEVAITGDRIKAPDFNIDFKSFGDTNFFDAVCFDEGGNGIPCATATGARATIQIGVTGDVPDGTHLMGVRMVETGGVRGRVQEITFTVDATAPDAPALVAPNANEFLNTSTPLFDWAVSSGNVFGYRLQVTTGDIKAGPYAIEVVLTGDITQFQVPAGKALADATYKWRVIARDRATNTASSVTRIFTVDTLTPAPPALRAPADQALLDTRTVDFQWDVSTTSGDVANYRLQVASNGDVGFTSPLVDRLIPDPAATGDRVTLASDGNFRWRVRAIDRAGNEAPLTSLEVRTFIADTTPPGVPALAFPVNGQVLNRAAVVSGGIRSVVFAWQASTGDVVKYRLQVTTGDIKTGSFAINVEIPHPTTTFSRDLADGAYSWRVTAIDKATNTAPSVTRTFVVDTTPPTAPGLVRPGTGDFVTTTSVLFDWNASSGDVVDYLVRVVVSGGNIETGPFIIEIPVRGTEFTGDLQDGPYQYQVIARDRALNLAPSVVRPFTVDTLAPGAPELVAPPDGVLLNTRAIDFRWNVSASSDVASYRLQVASSGDAAFTSPVVDRVIADPSVTGDRVTFTADGPFRWRVRARDDAGNGTASGDLEVRTFAVDTQDPLAPTSLTAVQSDKVTQQFTWDRSTDPGFITLGNPLNTGSGVDFYTVIATRTFDNAVVVSGRLPDSSCDPSTCEFGLTTVLTAGQYIVAVIAVDRATKTSAPATKLFQEGLDTVVQSLRIVGSVFGNTVNVSRPDFRWNPPSRLPDTGDQQQGGIDTYTVAITGDAARAPDFRIPFTPFTDANFFKLDCVVGGSNRTGDDCKKAIGQFDTIQISVTGDIPDGTHLLGVRVVATRDVLPRPAVEVAFSVDTQPPAPPALVAPQNRAVVTSRTVGFQWKASTSDDIASYRLGGTLTIESEFTDLGELDIHTATIDWGDNTTEPGTVAETDGSGTVSGSHEYTDSGTFTVTVSVADDDEATGDASLEVVVLATVALVEGIEVTNLAVSPEIVVPPNRAKVTFVVTDTRATGDTRTNAIDMLVNGAVEETFEVTSRPGESKPQESFVDRTAAGAYAVQVVNLVRTFTIEAPRLAITNVRVSPRSAAPGSVIEISADVTNVGGVTGTFIVDIRVDGDSQPGTIRLPAGRSAAVVRFVGIPDPIPGSGVGSAGRHLVEIDGANDFYIVRRPAIVREVPNQAPVHSGANQRD